MPTYRQISNEVRTKKKKKVKCPSLRGCPQKKGVCIKIFICSPRKPNSARRRVARLRLSNKIRLTAYIPGQSHNLQEHSQVLVRGGRIPDLPGVKYRLVRNKIDLEPLRDRISSRSKYGVKKIS